MDPDFLKICLRLSSLVTGLEGGGFHCACRRYHKLSITDDLQQTLSEFNAELKRQTGKTDIVPDNTRFTFLEVDE